ncbi:hypothetical protein CROQUDRAFT_235345 [Cronartium quercuum f. sp. fusiforme G11]|uniref:Uncharacterized protein n=1 Tax=Cronartium quercuum f. sp. fusiforme G11 TaxID=708437 RepID=A0A9P6NEY5_9BASI|nr:hypothetical protein CROQUDRAFT_235345 [Cronartium quercuum f. sp. fusiforme G11]
MSVQNSIIKSAWLCLLCITLVWANPLPGTKLVGRGMKVSDPAETLHEATEISGEAKFQDVSMKSTSKERTLKSEKIEQEETTHDPNVEEETKPLIIQQDEPEPKKTLPYRAWSNLQILLEKIRTKIKKNSETKVIVIQEEKVEHKVSTPPVVVQKAEEEEEGKGKVKPEVTAPQVIILPHDLGWFKRWLFTSKSLVARAFRILRRYFIRNKPKRETDPKKDPAEKVKNVEKNKKSEQGKGSVKQPERVESNKIQPVSD